MNLTDVITEQAERQPQAVAVHMAQGDITFPVLDTLVWRAATWLSRQGVGPGQVIGVACQAEIAILVAILAAARIGATTCAVAVNLPQPMRDELLDSVDAQILLTDTPGLDAINRRILVLDPTTLLDPAAPLDLGVRAPSPTAPWAIVSGSGSTGKAKLIPCSHEGLIARRDNYAASLGLVAGDRMASLVRLEYTSVQQFGLSCLAAGASLVFLGKAANDPSRVIDLVKQYRVDVLGATVMHMEQILATLGHEPRGLLAGIKGLALGASVITDDLKKRVSTALTPNIVVAYGANECGLLTSARLPHTGNQPGSVGLPLPGVEIQVVDDNDNPMPRGEAGLIRARAPGMIAGYFNDAEATAHAFRQGWFYPGDICRLDVSGELIYCGRADHMMIMNGINIYPAEIERVMSSHPDVLDVAAVPLSSPVHQDVPVCAVTLKSGATATPQDLLAYAHERLGSRGPRAAFIVPALPRNSLGTLVRAELFKQLRQQSPTAQP